MGRGQEQNTELEAVAYLSLRMSVSSNASFILAFRFFYRRFHRIKAGRKVDCSLPVR